VPASNHISDARFHALIEHVPAGVVVHGGQSEILIANQAASAILGLSQDQLVGRVAIDPHWRFITADGQPMPLEDYPVNQILRSGQPFRDLVMGIERPDRDSPVWVICNAFTLLDEQGALREAVVSFTDVTELKQAERALQKSEERLRLILQGSRDASWDWDLVAGTQYFSPTWWHMLGYLPEELPNDVDFWRHMLHPSDRALTLETIRKALKSGQTSFELECRLKHKDGRTVPVLSRGLILRDSLGRAIRVAGTNSDMSERKQVEQEIHQLAFYDALTGLANRRLLMEQLRKVRHGSSRRKHQIALLFIDLDNFKLLNDTLGHDMGDLLLQEVAKRLQHCVRTADTVARLGGDEFVVMLENLSPAPPTAAIEAELVGQKIIASLNAPYQLQEIEYRNTASIGIALYNDMSQGVDSLLKQADLAMYQAKAMGRNRLRFFDPGMQTEVDRRVTLEQDLRQGLQDQEMILYFQAQFDDSGVAIGAEALVRWRHSQHGLILPDDFLPLAEATGLILPLGGWVLGTACERLAAWSKDSRLSRLSLSVNISLQQIRQPDFVADLVALLRQSGANPDRLVLELSERALDENLDEIIAKMVALKLVGVGFALDDFGTGHSSLGYLMRMPLTQLKIDQSFVHQATHRQSDATTTRVVIALAESLGLTVIAEAIEQQLQYDFLRANGCHQFQGNLLGRPLPAAEFESSLAPHLP
jgi:diguanylate cyclase (GGDEF)-like protein/PAS domain S-box-containing protein